jgi:predicted TIM-barrel enzyme
VVVGSGVTPENVHSFASNCDAVIVGSAFKHGGVWKNQVERERVRKLVHALEYAKT